MILTKDYFEVYGNILSETRNPKEAWWETEKEFSRRYSVSGPFAVRRFSDYRSCQEHYRRFKKDGQCHEVRIQLISLGDAEQGDPPK